MSCPAPLLKHCVSCLVMLALLLMLERVLEAGQCLRLFQLALCQQRVVLVVPCPAVLAVLLMLDRVLKVGQCFHLLDVVLCQ